MIDDEDNFQILIIAISHTIMHLLSMALMYYTY